jgi:hypothetical protein
MVPVSKMAFEWLHIPLLGSFVAAMWIEADVLRSGDGSEGELSEGPHVCKELLLVIDKGGVRSYCPQCWMNFIVCVHRTIFRSKGPRT